MSKRHNRKRTRSRPRHRDPNRANSNHTRTQSVDTNSSYSTTHSSFQPPPLPSANHWHETYSLWQSRLRYEQELEAQRLRFFGGEAGDDMSLLEPMMRVVTDLFDGDIDYEDP
ncbi:hypothetical protein P154DRAFT_445034 [Amniculicola lignicola CBS 123094]|uniref:Uncharacterized protein n=1 Tax=Amniculicola lignicola CBS 123094 TaxID=1392246 RepID=A0A6A5W3G3_9PLEO|nr:hypothetical protein P154DRAFT_445034 [Amniculicola lignicola CBS 123094]